MNNLICSNEILLVDADRKRRARLEPALQQGGFNVTIVEQHKIAFQCLKKGHFALLLLCLNLTGAESQRFLEAIHEQHPFLPVILILARRHRRLITEALSRGIYDFFINPVEAETVAARASEIIEKERLRLRRGQIVDQIRSLLSELNQLNQPSLLLNQPASLQDEIEQAKALKCGAILLDLDSRQVTVNHQPVHLTPSAFDYLTTLMRHSPLPVSYETLVRESQGYNLARFEAKEMARWHIHELRTALETDTNTPRHIITVRDLGYLLIS